MRTGHPDALRSSCAGGHLQMTCPGTLHHKLVGWEYSDHMGPGAPGTLSMTACLLLLFSLLQFKAVGPGQSSSVNPQ